jgi:hypothetical protein
MSGRVMIEGMRIGKVCFVVRICKGIACKGLEFRDRWWVDGIGCCMGLKDRAWRMISEHGL